MADRVEYIAGLRAIAQLLEDNDDLTLPFDGTTAQMTVFIKSPTPVAQALLYIQAMDSQPSVEIDHANGDIARLSVTGRIRGVEMDLRMRADETCEHRVTGVHRATDGSVHEITEWVIPSELTGKNEGGEPDA